MSANIPTKFKVIFFMTFIIVTCGCEQTKVKLSTEKTNIDFEQIVRIEIYKRATPIDLTNLSCRVLTYDQMKSFSEKWNQTGTSEQRKYISSYNLTLYSKNGTRRHFSGNGKFIKENIDHCFDFNDDDYFSKLYAHSNVFTVK